MKFSQGDSVRNNKVIGMGNKAVPIGTPGKVDRVTEQMCWVDFKGHPPTRLCWESSLNKA